MLTAEAAMVAAMLASLTVLCRYVWAIADTLTGWAPDPPGPGPAFAPKPPLDFDDIALHLALHDLTQRSNA